MIGTVLGATPSPPTGRPSSPGATVVPPSPSHLPSLPGSEVTQDLHGWWPNLLQGTAGSILSAILAGVISLIIARYVLIRTLNDQRDLSNRQLAEQRELLSRQVESERALATESLDRQLAEQRELLSRQIESERELAAHQRLQAATDRRAELARNTARSIIDIAVTLRSWVAEHEGQATPLLTISAQFMGAGDRITALAPALGEPLPVKAALRISTMLLALTAAFMQAQSHSVSDKPVAPELMEELKTYLAEAMVYTTAMIGRLSLFAAELPLPSSAPSMPESLAQFLQARGGLNLQSDIFSDDPLPEI